MYFINVALVLSFNISKTKDFNKLCINNDNSSRSDYPESMVLEFKIDSPGLV